MKRSLQEVEERMRKISDRRADDAVNEGAVEDEDDDADALDLGELQPSDLKELRVSLTEQLKSTHFRWAGYHPRFITQLANKYPFVLPALGCVFSHRAAIDVPTSLRIERAGRKGQTATDLETEFAEMHIAWRLLRGDDWDKPE